MKPSFPFFLLFLGLFSACRKTPAVTTPETPQLWPLKAGSLWVYSRNSYYEDGTLKSSLTDTLAVVGTAQRNNVLYAQLYWNHQIDEVPPLIRSAEAAVYAYSNHSRQELLLFKRPVAESEVLFTESDSSRRQDCISLVGLYPNDNRQLHRVAIRNWEKDSMTSYVQLEFKPGVGLSSQSSFKRKASGRDFYKLFEATLTSYQIK